ncbi:MAG TPA: ATP synthase F0 subunit C [Candidatus Omnitrophota bacterium]|nr:ATP synthase F0 subunit C [Candidatus Omnitrophota bacterium]
MMRNVVMILIMMMCTIGPAAVVALVGYGAVKAVGRNPSASPRILMTMIVAFIFAEAIAIISLLLVYNLFQ